MSDATKPDRPRPRRDYREHGGERHARRASTVAEGGRRAADDQHRPAPPGHARGAAAARRRSRARSCATSSRSSATSTPASRRPARTRATGRSSRSSSGWTTSPTTSTCEAFCGAVEPLLELEIPTRAKYLRVIHLELNRIHSPPGLARHRRRSTSARSRCSGTASASATQILDLFEMSSGQRMHTRYFQVGGVFEDIPRRLRARRCASFCDDDARPRSTSTRRCSTATRSSSSARKGVGIVSRERAARARRHRPAAARRRRARGTCARPTPYLAYDDFDFKIPVGTVGDSYDRYRGPPRGDARVGADHRAGARRPARGPVHRRRPQVVLPPRHELATSMEALIHHFKLVTEGFRVPPGEVYYPIESPRGELGCFVRRRRLGEARARPLPRPVASSTCRRCATMCVGGYVADLIAEPGDARPDPRRDRPMSDRPEHASPRYAQRLARPRLGRRRRPRRKDPAVVPDPRDDARCPTTCAREIEAAMAKYPRAALGRRSRRCGPSSAATAGARRRAIDQAAAVMRRDAGLPRVGRELLRPVRAREPVGSHTVSSARTSRCSLRGARRAAARRSQEAGRGDDRGRSTCAASSASAPATSRRWPRSTSATSARSSADDAPARSRAAARRRARSLPDKQLARPRAAGEPDGQRRRALTLTETRILFQRHRRARACDTIEVYERRGGYQALQQGAAARSSPRSCSTSSRTPACAAAAAPASRWARRPPSCRAATWTSTSCCNADESEPGTFKDRELMQKNPHQLIEGIVDRRATPPAPTAAFIFIRGEYDLQARHPRRGGRRGLRGRLPRREHPRHRRRRSSWSSTAAPAPTSAARRPALLDSLEGKRGNPRLKPPFPADPGPLRRARR